METIFPDSPTLRRIINRHTKEDLINIAIRWLDLYAITRIKLEDNDEDGDFTMHSDDVASSLRTMTSTQYKQHVAKAYEALREKTNKKRVVDRILGVDWCTGLTARQVADLDLTYYSTHSNLKNWKALKLDYGDQGAIRTHVNPSKIEKTLSHYLAPYFKHHVQILQDKEMIWIRISVHDGLAPNTLPSPTTIVYFIWFTNSEYLLCAAIKAEWRDFIMEAILRLFKAKEIEEWPLTGKSPTSLAQLLLQKDAQGAHSRYRLNQLDPNPLLHAPRKRKDEDPHEKYSKGMDYIRSEDIGKIATRDRFVARDFGPNAQPGLNKVNIQLNLPYTEKSRDFDLGRLTKQPFPMMVTFEGSNVIEGIKSLIPLGIASNPMPEFLTNLHSMASNSLTVDRDEDDGNKQRITSG